MIPLRDSQPSGRLPLLTILLIAANIYVFFLELTSPNLEAFINQFALTPALVDFRSITSLLPFVTAMFLHGGILHIISNMLFLWIFGDNVEERLGLWYIPFYLLGGIVASLVQFFFTVGSTIPMLGASGAVASVLGAYLIFFPHHRVTTLVPVFWFLTVLNLPASIVLIYWFLTQLLNGVASLGFETAASGGVAFFAHIGGFVAGWLVASVILQLERARVSV